MTKFINKTRKEETISIINLNILLIMEVVKTKFNEVREKNLRQQNCFTWRNIPPLKTIIYANENCRGIAKAIAEDVKRQNQYDSPVVYENKILHNHQDPSFAAWLSQTKAENDKNFLIIAPKYDVLQFKNKVNGNFYYLYEEDCCLDILEYAQKYKEQQVRRKKYFNEYDFFLKFSIKYTDLICAYNNDFSTIVHCAFWCHLAQKEHDFIPQIMLLKKSEISKKILKGLGCLFVQEYFKSNVVDIMVSPIYCDVNKEIVDASFYYYVDESFEKIWNDKCNSQRKIVRSLFKDEADVSRNYPHNWLRELYRHFYYKKVISEYKEKLKEILE